jgi:hypothetical protein
VYYEEVMVSRPDESVREKFLDYFHKDAEAYLETIEVAIRHLKNVSKDYYGFDFSDEVDDMVKDAI